MRYFIALVVMGLFTGIAQAQEYTVEKATDTVVRITKTFISGDTKTIQQREVQADVELAALDKVIADLDGQIVQLQAQKTKLEEKKTAVLAAIEPDPEEPEVP